MFSHDDFGKSLELLGKAFINLVKMLIAPIIFCTVVHGIASMGDLKKLGRVGGKTLLYFEVVSTIALFVGLIVVNVFVFFLAFFLVGFVIFIHIFKDVL